jgi:hypothetical protein
MKHKKKGPEDVKQKKNAINQCTPLSSLTRGSFGGFLGSQQRAHRPPEDFFLRDGPHATNKNYKCRYPLIYERKCAVAFL